jgi:hypothetical protein
MIRKDLFPEWVVMALVVAFVISFRDVKIFGFGIAALQFMLGMVILIITPKGYREEAVFLKKTNRYWYWFLGYISLWSLMLLINTGQFWPGAIFDIVFAVAVLKWASRINPIQLRKWLVLVLGLYFVLNFAAGGFELLLGQDSISLLHKNEYGSSGRIRMLSAEPSNIYAPFLVGLGLIWSLRHKYRWILSLGICLFLVLSGSKAFPFVAALSIVFALLVGRSHNQLNNKMIMVWLLGVTVMIMVLIVTSSPIMSTLLNNNSSAGLFGTDINIADYILDLSEDGQGSLATRSTLYIHSINAFISNPIFGVGPAGEGESLLSRAEMTGLITPEIIQYSHDNPKFITSKTYGLSLLVSYGLPALLVVYYSIVNVIRQYGRSSIIFSISALAFSLFVTEGYNIFVWLVLCILAGQATSSPASTVITNPYRRNQLVGRDIVPA